MFCARPFPPLNKDQQSDTYQSLRVVTRPWGSLSCWKAPWISEWKNRAQNQKKESTIWFISLCLAHAEWNPRSTQPPKPKGDQPTSYKHSASCFLFCHKTCNFPLSFSPATPFLSPLLICPQMQFVSKSRVCCTSWFHSGCVSSLCSIWISIASHVSTFSESWKLRFKLDLKVINNLVF